MTGPLPVAAPSGVWHSRAPDVARCALARCGGCGEPLVPARAVWRGGARGPSFAPVFDATHPFASAFLWLVSVSFLAGIALPLLFSPLRWARWFRWKVPEGHADLTVYLGRCTGGLATAILLMLLRAAPSPAKHLSAFELIIEVAVVMTGVHLFGALQRAQPWTETAELALYLGVGGLALWLRVSLG